MWHIGPRLFVILRSTRNLELPLIRRILRAHRSLPQETGSETIENALWGRVGGRVGQGRAG